jgi:hypothetical protein
LIAAGDKTFAEPRTPSLGFASWTAGLGRELPARRVPDERDGSIGPSFV